MWISHKRAAVLCHTPAVVTPTSTRSQISMNCTIGNHGPKKSSLLLLLSGQSHKSLAHVIQHPAWFTQLASVPDILTFSVPSYYAATIIPCSHALTPSWTFLWLLYSPPYVLLHGSKFPETQLNHLLASSSGKFHLWSLPFGFYSTCV